MRLGVQTRKIEDIDNQSELQDHPLVVKIQGRVRVRADIGIEKFGAGDGDRTRDIRLGKPTFYR